VLLVLTPLFKTTEGVVVGFQIFAWAAKNSGKTKKIDPTPGPLGAIFRVLNF
jgi:hypothetical protein